MEKYLTLADVPAEKHAEAIYSLRVDAPERYKGLPWHKFKCRILYAPLMALRLKWEDNHWCERNPKRACVVRDSGPRYNN